MKNKGWIILEISIISLFALLIVAGVWFLLKTEQISKSKMIPKVEQCLEKCELKCSQLQ